MTWTTKVKLTRPSTDVDWYAEPTEEKFFRNSEDATDEFKAHGAAKRISNSISISDNELEVIKTFIWQDETSHDEYRQFASFKNFIRKRDLHNRTNNITLERLQNEET